MYHSGIGGGGFMLIHKPDGKNETVPYEFVDFRETAPAAATENMFKNNVNASIYGGQARYKTHSSAMPMTDSLPVACPASYEV
jgi:gamma-glutamyltranspeptidase